MTGSLSKSSAVADPLPAEPPDRRGDRVETETQGQTAAAAAGDVDRAGNLAAMERAFVHHMGDEGGWYADPNRETEAEPWQITYLDTITLLLILFILLSTLHPIVDLPPRADDQAGGGDRAEDMAPVDLTLPMMEPVPGSLVRPPVAIGPQGLSDDDVAALSDPPATSETSPADPTGPTDPTEETSTSARTLRDDISALISDQNLGESVDLSLDAATVSIQMSDTLLFPSGQSGLTDEGGAVLADVAPLLSTIEGQISVEGHTDPVPINTTQFPSNWHLSTARAVSVLRELIDDGVPAETLRAVGHADTRPTADNATAEGRATNRRVSIVVTMDAETPRN